MVHIAERLPPNTTEMPKLRAIAAMAVPMLPEPALSSFYLVEGSMYS